jgi:mRNA interferase RelE/StbE
MTDKIEKFTKSLDEKTKKRLKQKLQAIKKDPYNQKDVKKLQGLGKDIFRFRMGKIRIIYQIIDQEVIILDIDYRGNIY